MWTSTVALTKLRLLTTAFFTGIYKTSHLHEEIQRLTWQEIE